jgi:aspartokinase-like uncharacterized kinase
VRRAVVKLGGSTAHTPEFDLWIAALGGSAMPLVIVPGGGPFADKVREMQKSMGISDEAAHLMAILAVDQFGHALADRHDRLFVCDSLEEIDQVLGLDRVPVWLPSKVAGAAPDIPRSWDVTSDSLAAWLSGKIGADALLLVKQSADFSEEDTVNTLADREIVDRCFPTMLPPDIDFLIAGPDDAAEAGSQLLSGRFPGTKISRAASKVEMTG